MQLVEIINGVIHFFQKTNNNRYRNKKKNVVIKLIIYIELKINKIKTNFNINIKDVNN